MILKEFSEVRRSDSKFLFTGVESCDARESMYQEFLKIRDQEDPYRNKYMSDPPDTVAYADALVAEKTLTMEHVANWVERWKRHLGPWLPQIFC